MLSNNVANICYFLNKPCLFFGFFLIDTLIEKFEFTIVLILMSSFNERCKNCTLCKFTSERSNFSHA